MRTQSSDTSPEAERVQIELIRKAPISKRVALMAGMSQFLIEAHKQGIRQTHPNINEKEVGLIFVANNYGQELTDKLKIYLSATSKTNTTSHSYHLIDALTPIITTFELLGVTYYLTGALASAFYGILSTAIEATSAESLLFVANLQPEHVQPFSSLLASSYYINTNAVRDAIQHLYPQSPLIRSGRTTQNTATTSDERYASLLCSLPRRHYSQQTRMVQNGWRCLRPPMERHPRCSQSLGH